MLDELQHLLLVAEHGTLTEAARRAKLTQPALSASLRRLEERFKTKLCHRGRHGAELTAAGQALLPRARQVLAAMSDAERAVAEVSGLHAGEVRIAAGATVCTYLLPPYLSRFRKKHPGIHLRIREANSNDVRDLLADGIADLGVVGAGPGETWLDDELVLVGAPGYQHDGHTFVSFPPGATTRELLEKHFPEADIAVELEGIAAVKTHVRAGLGLALLSRASIANDLTTGRLVEIRDKRTPLKRTWKLVHRGIERLPPSAAALRTMLLERERSAKSKAK